MKPLNTATQLAAALSCSNTCLLFLLSPIHLLQAPMNMTILVFVCMCVGGFSTSLYFCSEWPPPMPFNESLPWKWFVFNRKATVRRILRTICHNDRKPKMSSAVSVRENFFSSSLLDQPSNMHFSWLLIKRLRHWKSYRSMNVEYYLSRCQKA